MKRVRIQPSMTSHWVFRLVLIKEFRHYTSDIEKGLYSVESITVQENGRRLIVGQIESPIFNGSGVRVGIKVKARLACLVDVDGNYEIHPPPAQP